MYAVCNGRVNGCCQIEWLFLPPLGKTRVKQPWKLHLSEACILGSFLYFFPWISVPWYLKEPIK